MKSLLILSYFILLPFCVCGQEVYMQYFSDKEGLPNMTIYDILQDKKGYIWLGTDGGIVRYDGTQFDTFEVPCAKSNAFSYLQQDKNGTIYFQNFSGQFFYIQNEKSYCLDLPKDFNYNKLNKFWLDAQQEIIWVINKSIYQYQIRKKEWKKINIPQIKNIENAKNTHITQDQKGTIWLLIDNNLFEIYDQKLIQTIDLKGLNINKVYVIGDRIFLLESNKNVIYEYKKQEKIKTSLSEFLTNSAYITHITTDNERNLWIATLEGAFLIDKENTIYPFTFLKNKHISACTQDREGNFWFGTIGKGLYMMPNKDIWFFNTQNSALKSDQIKCLGEDEQSNILIGANYPEVWKINQAGKIIQKYELPLGDVECLFFDKKRKQILVEALAINVFDVNSSKPKHSFFAGSSPKDIALFDENNLIVAAGDAAYAIDITQKAGDKPPMNPAYRQNFKQDIVPKKNVLYPNLVFRQMRSRCTYVDNDTQNIWIGFDDGLFCYQNAKEEEIKTPQQEKIIAKCIIKDKEGVLWVGTLKQGIFVIKNKKVIQHFTQKNGLLSNYCKKLKLDNQTLWIGTDKGIQALDLITKKSDFYTQQDGLISSEINDIWMQKDRIWLATNKGLVVFDKQMKSKNLIAPLIYITHFFISEKASKLQPKYHLSYQENNLKIDFRAISFRSEGAFKYKYRMLGLDSNWIYVKSVNNYVRYASLPSGNYEFQLKSINEDNIESEKIAKIEIKIDAPYWRTWWFMFLMFLLGISLVSLFFMARIKTLKRRNDLENQLQNAQLLGLKTQMNPHFLFNVLNSIKGFMYENDKKNAILYLDKFSNLVRKILQNSEVDLITLHEEIEMLSGYIELEKMLLEDDFVWELEKDVNIDTSLMLPTLLIQPFVENAFKHGLRHQKGIKELKISFLLPNPDQLQIVIEDNGIGRKKSAEINQKNYVNHQSFALKNINNRIALLNQKQQFKIKINIIDKIDAENQAKGTKIILQIDYETRRN